MHKGGLVHGEDFVEANAWPSSIDLPRHAERGGIRRPSAIGSPCQNGNCVCAVGQTGKLNGSGSVGFHTEQIIIQLDPIFSRAGDTQCRRCEWRRGARHADHLQLGRRCERLFELTCHELPPPVHPRFHLVPRGLGDCSAECLLEHSVELGFRESCLDQLKEYSVINRFDLRVMKEGVEHRQTIRAV